MQQLGCPGAGVTRTAVKCFISRRTLRYEPNGYEPFGKAPWAPRTVIAPYSPFTIAHSPGLFWFRPHRGSLPHGRTC